MSNTLMPRYLEVWLHGNHIGWLCEAGRTTRFIATERFLADTQRATLSLSMTLPGAERVTQETLKNYFEPAVYRERGELPPFFGGLLPEGALRRRLAATRRHDRDRLHEHEHEQEQPTDPGKSICIARRPIAIQSPADATLARHLA